MQFNKPDTGKRIVEGIILSLIPLVLASIFYLVPVPVQQTLALDHTDPVLYTFWTNSLIHSHQSGSGHLINNIVWYSLIIFPCWSLYCFLDERRKFWSGFFILILFAPLVASLSSYVIFEVIMDFGIRADRGFSGVVGAVGGFLLMSIITTFVREQGEKVSVLSVGLYFSILVLQLGISTSRKLWTSVGLISLTIVSAGSNTEYLSSFQKLQNWMTENSRLSILILMCVFVSVMVFAASLPSNIVSSSGGLKNIVAHGAGLLFGMGVQIYLSNYSTASKAMFRKQTS